MTISGDVMSICSPPVDDLAASFVMDMYNCVVVLSVQQSPE